MKKFSVVMTLELEVEADTPFEAVMMSKYRTIGESDSINSIYISECREPELIPPPYAVTHKE